MKAKAQHHYFVSCVYMWVAADTEAEALRKLGTNIGPAILGDSRKRNSGLLTKICRVELPLEAEYSISEYTPVDVPISECRTVRLLNTRGDIA